MSDILRDNEVTELTQNGKKYTVIQDDIVVNENRFLPTGTISIVQTPYVALKIKSPKHAAAASLHLILKHVADMHMLILEVLSQKYNIPYNDMIDVIHTDDRVQKFMIDPIVHSMNYFTQEDLDASMAELNIKEESEVAQPIPEPVKKLVRPKIKFDLPEEISTSVSQADPQPDPAPANQKKKIIRKKKSAE
jgi:hypothetical protein